MSALKLFERKCKSLVKFQVAMAKFVRKYPTWNSYALDSDTVECVCALSNLGIVTVKGDQMILKSATKTDQFISAREG